METIIRVPMDAVIHLPKVPQGSHPLDGAVLLGATWTVVSERF